MTEFKDKQIFTGALTKQIDDLLQYISLNNKTRVQFNGGPQRKETRDYPPEAVREAVVTLLPTVTIYYIHLLSTIFC